MEGERRREGETERERRREGETEGEREHMTSDHDLEST